MTSEGSEAEVDSSSRRRSGRQRKAPEKFAKFSPTDSAKRKRDDNDDSGVEADEPSEEEESSEGEPDEEELRERQRKNKKSKAAAKKPAPKKPKTNGATMSLAIRPAMGAAKKVAKRPRKAAIRKGAIAEDEPEGLYGM
jgi:cohesin complex subunit SA-1/2